MNTLCSLSFGLTLLGLGAALLTSCASKTAPPASPSAGPSAVQKQIYRIATDARLTPQQKSQQIAALTPKKP